jgi:hypothetical protein
LGILALVLLAIGAQPNFALAQSAADKATARTLATEGIQLFRQDRFADALDKLERAEALFDAPVHLLYIARCQARLNRLVEAAEAYRRLVRTELPPQAPQTFKDAVADGQKELPDVEPRIPSLRVDVTPTNVKDVRLTIDGEVVSSAVIGVDRPINPGAHVIEVSAKGQITVSKRVDVSAASKQVVKLDLVAAPSSTSTEGTPDTTPGGGDASSGPSGRELGTPSVGSRKTTAGTSKDQSGAGAVGEVQEPTPRRVRIVLGLDFSGVLPFAGKLDNQKDNGKSPTDPKADGLGAGDDRAMTARYGIGGGVELKAGVGIPVGKFYLMPLVFGAFYSHRPGPHYNLPADQSFDMNGGVDSVMRTKPTSSAIGVGLRFDNTPLAPLELGGFGEIGALLRTTYSSKGTWEVIDPANPGKCEFTEEFAGYGMRVRAGILLSASRNVNLVGSAGISLGTITKDGVSQKTCTGDLDFKSPDVATVPTGSRATYAVFGLGLGAEFGIGL